MKKTCKYCNEVFEAESKHAKVCPECKNRNHRNKVIGNLFSETHQIYS